MTKLGQWGEQLAVDYLRKHGYKILQRNFRTRLGEIDIIAQKAQVLVFIEVKSATHNQNFSPEAHFTKTKRERLKRTIELYLRSENITPEKLSLSLDLITIELEGKSLKSLHHYQNVAD